MMRLPVAMKRALADVVKSSLQLEVVIEHSKSTPT